MSHPKWSSVNDRVTRTIPMPHSTELAYTPLGGGMTWMYIISADHRFLYLQPRDVDVQLNRIDTISNAYSGVFDKACMEPLKCSEMRAFRIWLSVTLRNSFSLSRSFCRHNHITTSPHLYSSIFIAFIQESNYSALDLACICSSSTTVCSICTV